jgi:uncharacterized protein YecT (DUF1311 family)
MGREYSKQCTWIAVGLFGCLTIAQHTYAASFDCAKARTNVEKAICADAELSKQDERMAALYGEVLKASSNNSVLKKAQREWLKYRQTCFTPAYKQKENFCLSDRYRSHIRILRGSLPAELGADDNVNQLCVHIAALVETGGSFKLEPESDVDPPTGTNYRNLDIDGDGIMDSVKSGCGTGECSLEVKLSSGGEFSFGDSKFYLIRYKSKVYALVSYSEDEESVDMVIRDKYHLGRLYLIAHAGVKLVCGK